MTSPDRTGRKHRAGAPAANSAAQYSWRVTRPTITHTAVMMPGTTSAARFIRRMWLVLFLNRGELRPASFCTASHPCLRERGDGKSASERPARIVASEKATGRGLSRVGHVGERWTRFTIRRDDASPVEPNAFLEDAGERRGSAPVLEDIAVRERHGHARAPERSSASLRGALGHWPPWTRLGGRYPITASWKALGAAEPPIVSCVFPVTIKKTIWFSGTAT